MKTHPCPKCDSTEREPGKLYEVGSLRDVRFKSDADSAFVLKKQVVAVACTACGYLELFLTEPED